MASRDPEGLTVLNTLLQDLFLEQQNIVHLGDQRRYRFAHLHPRFRAAHLHHTAMTKQEKAALSPPSSPSSIPPRPSPDHVHPYTLCWWPVPERAVHGQEGERDHAAAVRPGEHPARHGEAEREEIRETIRPCGLSPMKSKGIHGPSRTYPEEHGGEVPADMAAWRPCPVWATRPPAW